MKKFMFLLCAMTALVSCSNDNENGLNVNGEENASLTGTHEFRTHGLIVSDASWSYSYKEGALSYNKSQVVFESFDLDEIESIQAGLNIIAGLRYTFQPHRTVDGVLYPYQLIWKSQPYAEFWVDDKLVLPASQQ
ncbi:hypothetical protein Barb6XT_00498 [Bacteroidales bacterium Barb6XT]|nr:hypothetical protein Barb6XT_00498 [Bacteroidales bacterium Barb6XT]